MSVCVYLYLIQEALPSYSSIASLIVSALMLQWLACPLGHMLTFCIKTFQLKIVAPSINLAPLSMCFSLVPIPVEKMKNVFYACSPEGGCESYPLTVSVIPFTKGLYLLQALAIAFLSKRIFRKWCMKHKKEKIPDDQ